MDILRRIWYMILGFFGFISVMYYNALLVVLDKLENKESKDV